MLKKTTNNYLSFLQSPPTKRALKSSGVMAFAGIGDAILYPVLPVYAIELGIPLLWVGLLLSINRFVRIAANTWIANIVNTFGMKKTLFISASFAVITTVFYGLQFGLISFVIARIVWGLCYSGLKIVTLNYAAKVETKSGLIFGLTQSIKSIGALFILTIGPILIEYFGIHNSFFVIASISFVAILFVISLPNISYEKTVKVKTRKTFALTSINLLVNFLAFSIDGILVVTLANLLNPTANNLHHLLVLVAFYLLLKRLFMVGVSFISGLITVVISPIKIFNLAVIFCVFGLLLIAFNQLIIGIVLVFLFNTIIVAFAPLISILNQKKESSLQIISSISTWWDLGAGIGSFLGLILIEKMGSQFLFILLSVLISILFIKFIIQNGKSNSTNI